jgi:integrase
MASVWKRKIDRADSTKPWRYTFEYQIRNPDGTISKRKKNGTGYRDKRETCKLANQLEDEARAHFEGRIDPREEQLTLQRHRPISEHIKEYESHLKSKGSSASHVRQTTGYIETASTALDWSTTDSMKASAVQDWLAELQEKNNLSPRTLNARRTALRGFSRWLMTHGRTTTHTLAAVSPIRSSDPKHQQTFTPDEIKFLIEHVNHSESRHGITGWDRSMLYLILASSGLRIGEAASLTRESFSLDACTYIVTVSAAYSKRRRQDVQPLPSELTPVLKKWLKTKPPSKRLWRLPSKQRLALLVPDLKAARRAWIDQAQDAKARHERRRSEFLSPKRANGRLLGFHSFRRAYITRLVMSGTPVSVSQRLARHSDPKLTLQVYAEVTLSDEQQALENAFGETPGQSKKLA